MYDHIGADTFEHFNLRYESRDKENYLEEIIATKKNCSST